MQINFSFLKKLNDFLKLYYIGEEDSILKIIRVCESDQKYGKLEELLPKDDDERICESSCSWSRRLGTDSLVGICNDEVQEEVPHKRRLDFSFSNSEHFKLLIDNRGKTFSEKLFELIDEKGLTEVEVYTKANLDRRLFSKLRRREHTPSKNTVFALIIGMRLNMAEAKELLSYAGYAFKPSSAVDMIVNFFIEEEIYDMVELNMVLDKYGLGLLGNIVL